MLSYTSSLYILDINPLFDVLFPGGSVGKELACNVGDLGLILGWEDSLEKEMSTHNSTLALKIPWMEKLGAPLPATVTQEKPHVLS